MPLLRASHKIVLVSVSREWICDAVWAHPGVLRETSCALNSVGRSWHSPSCLWRHHPCPARSQASTSDLTARLTELQTQLSACSFLNRLQDPVRKRRDWACWNFSYVDFKKKWHSIFSPVGTWWHCLRWTCNQSAPSEHLCWAGPGSAKHSVKRLWPGLQVGHSPMGRHT